LKKTERKSKKLKGKKRNLGKRKIKKGFYLKEDKDCLVKEVIVS